RRHTRWPRDWSSDVCSSDLVKDVARVELGSQDYTLVGRLNGRPSAVIAVYQLPGSNAVQAAEAVNKLMAEARKRFPDDMDFSISLDTTHAVTEGMREIIRTLVIAILQIGRAHV